MYIKLKRCVSKLKEDYHASVYIKCLEGIEANCTSFSVELKQRLSAAISVSLLKYISEFTI